MNQRSREVDKCLTNSRWRVRCCNWALTLWVWVVVLVTMIPAGLKPTPKGLIFAHINKTFGQGHRSEYCARDTRAFLFAFSHMPREGEVYGLLARNISAHAIHTLAFLKETCVKKRKENVIHPSASDYASAPMKLCPILYSSYPYPVWCTLSSPFVRGELKMCSYRNVSELLTCLTCWKSQ